MKDFFRYLAWGVLGLLLQMAFPSLRLDWLTLVWGAAALAQGPRFAIAVGAPLALLFAAPSAEAPWSIFLPRALCLTLWGLAPRWISLDGKFQAFLLFLSLALSGFALRFSTAGLGTAAAWAAATAVLGAWVLPVGGRWLGRAWRALRPRRSARGLETMERRRRALTRLEAPRGPFGLHRGV